MLSAVLRDTETVPARRNCRLSGWRSSPTSKTALRRDGGARGKAVTRLRAAIGLALDFLHLADVNERGSQSRRGDVVMSSAARRTA